MSVVRLETAGQAENLSPAIWADYPSVKAIMDPSQVIDIFDDFVDPVVADTSVPNWEFTGTNGDVDNSADEPNGVILLEGSGADNDSATIMKNDLYLLARSSGKRFWFEARVKLAAAGTADDFAAFVGLAESVAGTAELIADDGATIIDEDHIGFKAITNATTIGDWDATVNIGGSANFPVDIEADTAETTTSWVKLGMKFDGKKTVTFFVDGVKTTSYDVTNLDSYTMLHELTVVIGVKDCEAAQLGLYVDWVRFACEKNANGS